MSESAIKLGATVEFGGFSCEVYASSYLYGGATALSLIDARDGEPVAVATINVEGVSEHLPEDEALIKDYSEGEGMLAALEEASLVEDTGRRVRTGYVEVPVGSGSCMSITEPRSGVEPEEETMHASTPPIPPF